MALRSNHLASICRSSGHCPIGLKRMLRIHFLQQWYKLRDPAAEEALHDSHAMRKFVGIDLGREAVPGETTVCKFRHLLEKHGIAEKLFRAVQEQAAKTAIPSNQ